MYKICYSYTYINSNSFQFYLFKILQLILDISDWLDFSTWPKVINCEADA